MVPLNINQLKQLKRLDQRAQSGQMTSEDFRLLRSLIESHRELVNLLKDPDTSRDDLSAYLPDYENDQTAEGTVAPDCIDSLPEDSDE